MEAFHSPEKAMHGGAFAEFASLTQEGFYQPEPQLRYAPSAAAPYGGHHHRYGHPEPYDNVEAREFLPHFMMPPNCRSSQGLFFEAPW